MLAILVALVETLGTLGPELGQEILGWIVETAGWRTGLMVCGWVGLLLLFMILFVRNSPGTEDPVGTARAPLAPWGLARLLLSRQFVLVALVGGMI